MLRESNLFVTRRRAISQTKVMIRGISVFKRFASSKVAWPTYEQTMTKKNFHERQHAVGKWNHFSSSKERRAISYFAKLLIDNRIL